MITVFLSHSSQDKPFVRELAAFLETQGDVTVWLDERQIAPGQNIVARLTDGLESDFILLILSPDSVASAWVSEEWTDAFWDQTNRRRPKLAAVLYRDCSIPRLLRNKKYFDLRTNHPQGFREIHSFLITRQPTPPPRVNQLPTRPPVFIGRERELATLRERLRVGVLAAVPKPEPGVSCGRTGSPARPQTRGRASPGGSGPERSMRPQALPSDFRRRRQRFSRRFGSGRSVLCPGHDTSCHAAVFAVSWTDRTAALLGNPVLRVVHSSCRSARGRAPSDRVPVDVSAVRVSAPWCKYFRWPHPLRRALHNCRPCRQPPTRRHSPYPRGHPGPRHAHAPFARRNGSLRSRRLWSRNGSYNRESRLSCFARLFATTRFEVTGRGTRSRFTTLSPAQFSPRSRHRDRKS